LTLEIEERMIASMERTTDSAPPHVGSATAAPEAAEVVVKVANPLEVPYRTGSYLIYDKGKSDNFRNASGLPEHPYQASGSHQLDYSEFAGVLYQQVVKPHSPSTIYLVDLREETHGFFDGSAVSWYADNDFSNVGQPKEWITADEKARLRALAGRTTQVFSIAADCQDNRKQGRVMPVSYEDVSVRTAYTEADAAKMLTAKLKTRVEHVRIPVTDHCAPSDAALEELRGLWKKVGGNDWVHFHCHGGDGRTTTFLALYDMLSWKRSGALLPSLEEFAHRQRQLFAYSLDPDAAKAWKKSLAEKRWAKLEAFRKSLGGR
jgi:Inositol hexakisphosphate